LKQTESITSVTEQSGNLIDFGKLYHHSNVSEQVVKLQRFFSIHPQTLTVQQPLLRQKSGGKRQLNLN
jgi:hypothetical protein